MMSSLYIGAMGMKVQGEGLNNVGNNLANVSTVGFKKQSMLFQDMMSQTLPVGGTGSQGPNQMGLGVGVGAVRTVHTQGGFEPGSSVTDLAIAGKGFFEVTSTDPNQANLGPRYTRAGNFRFDKEGWLREPGGMALSGRKVVNGVVSNTVEPIHIDQSAVAVSPPKPSTKLAVSMNLGSNIDKSKNETDPYFALAQAWDGTKEPPLPSDSYEYAQDLQFIDAAGSTQNLTVYFDGAPSMTNGYKVYEYTVAMDPKLDGAKGGTSAAGLLMSGTMTFNSSGQMMDMTALTLNGTDNKNLASWAMAPLVNGVPQIGLSVNTGAGALPQVLEMGFGMKGQWANPVMTAADFKSDSKIGYVNIDRTELNTTARTGSYSVANYLQDGKIKGDLYDISISDDGKIKGIYTNGDSVDLYEIPVVRFTSEDGLNHEGGNLYSAPVETAGKAEYGRAGTENYGKMISSQLETSNVDMSMEMVNLIVAQRSFQMNSKTVTTADTMLQKALELKRN